MSNMLTSCKDSNTLQSHNFHNPINVMSSANRAKPCKIKTFTTPPPMTTFSLIFCSPQIGCCSPKPGKTLAVLRKHFILVVESFLQAVRSTGCQIASNVFRLDIGIAILEKVLKDLNPRAQFGPGLEPKPRSKWPA